MSKMKVLLLSGLVFPGLGQIYCKRYVMGIPLVAVSTVALVYICYLLFSITALLTEQLLSGSISPAPAVLHDFILQKLHESEVSPGVVVGLVFACWLVSVLDILICWKSTIKPASKN